MSTLVRQTGLSGTALRYDTRAAMTLPDGSAVLVVHDPNTAGAPTGYGDGTGAEKIYVYSSTDRTTWTLRTTITSPLANPIRITSNVAADGTIGIVAWTTTAVRYISVPSTTWVAVAAQTPRTAISSPLVEDDWDIAFTDGNVPVLFGYRSNTSGSTQLQVFMYVRRTSDSTWITTAVATSETTATPKTVYQSVAGLVLLTGGSAAARNVVFAGGHGNGNTDDGIDVYTCLLNETTGVVSSITLRKNYSPAHIPGSATSVRARSIMLYPSDDNEYTLGAQHSEGGKRLGVARGTWDGTTYVETIPYASHKVDLDMVQYGMAKTYSSGRMSFVYASSAGNLVSAIAHIDVLTGAVSFSDLYFFDDKSQQTSLSPLGGTGRFVEYTTHDIIFTKKISSSKQEFWHHYAKPLRAPTGVIPGNGSTVVTAEPTVRAQADIDLNSPQSLIKMQWEFARDVAFTTSEFTFSQDDSKYALVKGTNVTGVTVAFNDVLPADIPLNGQGVWYVRAAHIDEYGVVGAYSSINSFTVAHPPTPANIDPGGLAVRAYGTGIFTHKWVFTDPWDDDHQTAYRITVDNLDTGATVGDTGKVSSLNPTGNISLPIGVKNAALRSSIQLWDVDDVSGVLTPGTPWVTADAVAVTITAPTAGSTVTTAIPTISSTVSFSGNRSVIKYKVDVIKTSTGAVIGGSGWQTVSLASGGSFSWVPPIELLANTTGYTFSVTVVDSWGIVSVPATVAVTTGWTPPATAAGVAVTVTPYNTEGMGWVLITWQDVGRDVDFTSWVVYRKMDLIDPITLAVLEDGEWEDLYHQTATAGSYQYEDYWARSGYKVSYRVEQQVTRYGDVVTSSNGVAKVNYPISDSYWVIDPDNSTAWKLGSVTSDSYGDEYEESEFSIIGRGRHVDVGERIGYSGTLTAQLRDSPGLTARQKRIRLEELKKTQNRRLYLRNPFGDVFRVSVRAMQFTRIPGVGQSEFVDVSIPYSEVAE